MGTENAGPENAGPMLSTLIDQKCGTGKCGTENSGPENVGAENGGPKMQGGKCRTRKMPDLQCRGLAFCDVTVSVEKLPRAIPKRPTVLKLQIFTS